MMSDLIFRMRTAQCMHSSMMEEASKQLVGLAELAAQLYNALTVVNSEEVYDTECLDSAIAAYERVFHGE